MSEDWLTTEQAAEISGYHPNSVRRLIVSGRIKGQKFGPVWQVEERSLLAYMERMDAKGKRRGPKPK